MFRHQDVPHDSESKFNAQVGEYLDKVVLESVRVKQAGAPISAGGEIVKMVESIIVSLRSHARILPQRGIDVPQTSQTDICGTRARSPVVSAEDNWPQPEGRGTVRGAVRRRWLLLRPTAKPIALEALMKRGRQAQRGTMLAGLGLVVAVMGAGGARAPDGPCMVTATVVRTVGPQIPWPPSRGFGKFYPPLIFAGVPDLPLQGFVAYDERRHKHDPVTILSAEGDNGPRRVAMVVGDLRLDTTAGQPMSEAVPAAIEQIVLKARPQDFFGLLSAGDTSVALPLGSDRDAIRAAAEQIRGHKQAKLGGKPVFDKLLEAASWFGPPRIGDSIILFGGIRHQGGDEMSELRARLTAGQIRLFVFTGTEMITTGGDMVSGTWVSPLAWLCDETGGGWQDVGYAGAKATDENLWLWKTEGESLYEMIRSVYLLRLERTDRNTVIDLSPQFRQQIARGVVIYPRPLPICRPDLTEILCKAGRLAQSETSSAIHVSVRTRR